jgi:DNA-binding MarR family transcriptional regulator
MPNLTDTQLVILSAAANRADGAVLPLPKLLKIRGAAVTNTLESLLKKGLFDEKPAHREGAAWRKDEDGRRTTLFISDGGLAVLDAEPPEKTAKPREVKGPNRSAPTKAPHKSDAVSSPRVVRAGTKQAQLVDLL